MDNITHCCCISLELGEVGQDNFSVGQKLVPGGVEFRLESLSFLPRELFMVSWSGNQKLDWSRDPLLGGVDDKVILRQ